MRSIGQCCIAGAIALLASGPACAWGVGPATTYSKLQWTASFTAPGVAGCSQLIFDATGDLAHSDTLVLAGALNCGNGGYGMTGSLYAAVDGSLSITMVAAGYTIACPRVFGWVGTCAIFDSAGYQRGTGTIALL